MRLHIYILHLSTVLAIKYPSAMCRTTDYHHHHIDRSHHNHAHDCFFNLKINAFFLRLSDFTPTNPLPESLTLLFLPRINENALQIRGFTIRPDSPAFTPLHRLTNSPALGDLIFGTTEPLLVGDGVQFEVYFRETKLIKGLFRKNEPHVWTLDCTCQLFHTDHKDFVATPGLSEAELCLAIEGSQIMTHKVAVVLKRRKKNRFSCRNINSSDYFTSNRLGLDEIPEVTGEYTSSSQEGDDACPESTCQSQTSCRSGGLHDCCASYPEPEQARIQPPNWEAREGDDVCSKCICHCQSGVGSGGLQDYSAEPDDVDIQVQPQSHDPFVMCGTTSRNLHMDTQGGRWALHLGIWAMFLGVGFVVSKVSVNGLRRKRIFR